MRDDLLGDDYSLSNIHQHLEYLKRAVPEINRKEPISDEEKSGLLTKCDELKHLIGYPAYHGQREDLIRCPPVWQALFEILLTVCNDSPYIPCAYGLTHVIRAINSCVEELKLGPDEPILKDTLSSWLSYDSKAQKWHLPQSEETFRYLEYGFWTITERGAIGMDPEAAARLFKASYSRFKRDDITQDLIDEHSASDVFKDLVSAFFREPCDFPIKDRIFPPRRNAKQRKARYEE